MGNTLEKSVLNYNDPHRLGPQQAALEEPSPHTSALIAVQERHKTMPPATASQH
jgi:hypothetical protein